MLFGQSLCLGQTSEHIQAGRCPFADMDSKPGYHIQCEVLPGQDTFGTGFVGLRPYKISYTISQPSS